MYVHWITFEHSSIKFDVYLTSNALSLVRAIIFSISESYITIFIVSLSSSPSPRWMNSCPPLMVSTCRSFQMVVFHRILQQLKMIPAAVLQVTATTTAATTQAIPVATTTISPMKLWSPRELVKFTLDVQWTIRPGGIIFWRRKQGPNCYKIQMASLPINFVKRFGFLIYHSRSSGESGAATTTLTGGGP